MGAQLRVYRRRIRSVQATKKITRAMELIAASRIVKAQQRVDAARPYAQEMRRALSAAASGTRVDHPLLREGGPRRRAAVLVLSSDRGLAGAYSSNAIREADALTGLLTADGLEVVPYLVGRKASAFYRFRNRTVGGEWTGFTEAPQYSDAVAIAEVLVAEFDKPYEEGGVDEIHIVYTHFRNMAVQDVAVLRVLPIEVVEEEQSETLAPEGQAVALYNFEPSAEGVLDALLRQYVAHLIYTCLVEASASELAARRRAMKSATDNAEELIKSYTRLANAARQAEITQEISEIVGGADALASATAGNE